MGLSALGIGLENVISNMPKSKYPVLFIVSLTLGVIIGTWLDIDGHFNQLVCKFGQSEIGKGLATEILLCCIGALSIVGPVMAAVKGDYTMLYTNATLDFVTSMVFGASFGLIMLLVAPVLCKMNKKRGERTNNTSPSIDEGMHSVLLLLFYFFNLMV